LSDRARAGRRDRGGGRRDLAENRGCTREVTRAHSAAEDEPMNCPRCATINLDGSVVCASCGAQLPAAGAYAAPPPGGAPGYPPGPPPGYYPPPYGVPMNVAPTTSGMAVAGFVLSFLCALLGLIFSIIGYNEVKNSNGMKTGGGLALAGIIIAIVNMLLGILIMAGSK
jgi:hypothetical protein